MNEEERIDQSTDNSQRSTEENKTAEQPLTINNEPITNMEVHHHPHVEKKNFKEYFLEFIMIFLAVTMGFFAETIRETISEHTLAKEYAASLVKDLQADTSQLKIYNRYYNYATKNTDTLLQILAQSDPQNIPSGKLYWYGLFGGAHGSFIPDDATLQQIKSTGSLRYFKRNIAGDIADYDRLCHNLQTFQQQGESVYTEVRKSRAQIFEFKYNDAANDIYQAGKTTGDRSKIDSFIKSNPPLLSYDKVLFNEYAEMVRSRFMYAHVTYSDSILQHADVLLNELRKEYHLEGE